MATLSAIGPVKISGFYSLKVPAEWLLKHIEIGLVMLMFIAYQLYAWQFVHLNQTVISHPRQNDFFYIDYLAIDKNSDFRYRYIPMKVIAVNDDTVSFKVGNIAHSKPVSPRQHA